MTTHAQPWSDQAIQAAWRRYVVVLVGVALVFVVLIVFLLPRWLYDGALERFVLPEYEAAFGFWGGRLHVAPEDPRHTVYTIVEVEPNGRMARAGARAGDIPLEAHGGLGPFHAALRNASSTKDGHFTVLAHSDWPDWDKRRKIVLLPERESR